MAKVNSIQSSLGELCLKGVKRHACSLTILVMGTLFLLSSVVDNRFFGLNVIITSELMSLSSICTLISLLLFACKKTTQPKIESVSVKHLSSEDLDLDFEVDLVAEAEELTEQQIKEVLKIR